MRHLLPDAQDCRDAWAMLTEVAVGVALKSIGRRLLPDICGWPVSLFTSIDVCSERDVLACRV